MTRQLRYHRDVTIPSVIMQRTDVSPSCKILMGILLRLASEDRVYISLRSLAEVTGKSACQVRRWLVELESLGLVYYHDINTLTHLRMEIWIRGITKVGGPSWEPSDNLAVKEVQEIEEELEKKRWAYRRKKKYGY